MPTLTVAADIKPGVLPETVARRNAAVLDIVPVRLDDAVAQRRFRLCVRDLDGMPAAARLLLEHLRECAAQRVG